MNNLYAKQLRQVRNTNKGGYANRVNQLDRIHELLDGLTRSNSSDKARVTGTTQPPAAPINAINIAREPATKTNNRTTRTITTDSSVSDGKARNLEVLEKLMQLWKHSAELDKYEQHHLYENIRFLPTTILSKLYDAGSYAFVEKQKAGAVVYE